MDFVERTKYACDDSDSDSDPVSDSGLVSAASVRRCDRRESGVVMVGLVESEWKEDGGMGGYLAAMLQKGHLCEVMFVGVGLLMYTDVVLCSVCRIYFDVDPEIYIFKLYP